MHNWHEFLTMGGYARYVWPAYAVALAVLGLAVWLTRRGLRRAFAQALRRAREERE